MTNYETEPYWAHQPQDGHGDHDYPPGGVKVFNYNGMGGPPFPPHPPPPGTPLGLILGFVGGTMFLIAVCCGCCCWHRGRRAAGRRPWTDRLFRWPAGRKRVHAANLTTVTRNHYLNAEDLKPPRPTDPWESRAEDVIVHYDRKLGSGAFADVYVGQIIGDAGIRRVYNDVLSVANFHDCEVAVKMLPPFADDNSRADFQKEIVFMKSLKYHPHLVCLMGYVADAVSPLLLIEYCSRGDLLHFVRERKNQIVHGTESQENLKVKNLVSFAWQIANGLEYLNSIGCIPSRRRRPKRSAGREQRLQGDFLDLTPLQSICLRQIGDFGLCRLADSLIYTTRGGRLPVRWMSPESLKNFEYSSKSDVWSYGVLLYELFSFGEIPYAGLENNQVLEFLEKGQRLHKPAYCTEDLYELMGGCWKTSPVERLSFAEICLRLMRILENANSDYGYVTAVENPELTNIEVVVHETPESSGTTVEVPNDPEEVAPQRHCSSS
ncbi:Protein kinase domain-containing protein [Aphelenchoides fujianensis]|nr:Protein kinase domain-containing protein [Aphelenchoides fujianensis]